MTEIPSAPPAALRRLDKRLVELLGCSRAHAQALVEGGFVRVDGVVVEAPQTPVAGETVTVEPDAQPGRLLPASLLLNKPAGLAVDEALGLLLPQARAAGDDSGVRLLQRHFKHLVPLFPLETEACGLAVFSQDRALQVRVAEDGYLVEQEYVAEVRGDASEAALAKLARGASYDGERLPPVKLSWQSETRLRLAFKAGRPGLVYRYCAVLGLELASLRRLRLGRVGLAKMPEGQWRYLAPGMRF